MKDQAEKLYLKIERGELEASKVLLKSIESLTATGRVLTRNLGGTASTTEVTDELIKIIRK